jgi:hypothetical protein
MPAHAVSRRKLAQLSANFQFQSPSIGAGFQPFLAEDPHQYWGIAFDAFFSCRRFGATDWMPQCRPTGLTR